MKNLFLFLLATSLTITSCSSDDSSNSSNVVKAKINGVSKTFTNIAVTEQEYTDGGFTYTDVTVTAALSSEPTKLIQFVAEKGITGTDASWSFIYNDNDTFYEKTPTFTTTVIESSETKLKGTFAGSMSDGTQTIVVTGGSFNITY